MSGGISFSEDVYWGKAGWAYRAALEGICEELRALPGGEDLAKELSAEIHPAQWCEHLDLSEWSEAKKRVFFKAVHRCLATQTKRGPTDWSDPTFFPGFLRALQELDQLTSNAEQNIKDKR